MSIRLARKTMEYNGLTPRFTLYHGDLRDKLWVHLKGTRAYPIQRLICFAKIIVCYLHGNG